MIVRNGRQTIDYGPSNGTHTRGPVSGGLVQPAPPIPNGRAGITRSADRHVLSSRERHRRARGPLCGLVMPKSGESCVKAWGHRDHCRKAPSREPIA